MSFTYRFLRNMHNDYDDWFLRWQLHSIWLFIYKYMRAARLDFTSVMGGPWNDSEQRHDEHEDTTPGCSGVVEVGVSRRTIPLERPSPLKL
jgi:hypothetical protein